MFITFTVSGDFEADATGFANGQGPGAGLEQDGHLGGSGGAHGGRGGHSLYGYYSATGYDSIYRPSAMGSGGGNGNDGRGGRGGGRVASLLSSGYIVVKSFFQAQRAGLA